MCAKEIVDGVDDDGGEGAKGGEGTNAKHRRGYRNSLVEGERRGRGESFGGKRHGPRTRKRGPT